MVSENTMVIGFSVLIFGVLDLGLQVKISYRTQFKLKRKIHEYISLDHPNRHILSKWNM